MLQELRDSALDQEEIEEAVSESEVAIIEDDWLNVFERYAEDASSERMQKLWGRVLAGQVRSASKYSLRTLRFLSEFSQKDAESFSDLSKLGFGIYLPKSIVKPNEEQSIESLIELEAIGLIKGADGFGFTAPFKFDANGDGMVIEGDKGLLLKGPPNGVVNVPVLAMTPLGVELATLVPDRIPRECAETLANAVRGLGVSHAYFVHLKQPNKPHEIIYEPSNQQLVEPTLEGQ